MEKPWTDYILSLLASFLFSFCSLYRQAVHKTTSSMPKIALWIFVLIQKITKFQFTLKNITSILILFSQEVLFHISVSTDISTLNSALKLLMLCLWNLVKEEVKFLNKTEISGSHDEVVRRWLPCGLLHLLSGSLPTFQRCLLPPSLDTHCPEDGGSKHPWNDKFLTDYTAQKPRRPPSSIWYTSWI
jgi:hypothetical protein